MRYRDILNETAVADAAFQNWFAGSKVVRHGRPLLLYHGTQAEFLKFDPSYFFSGMNDGEAETAGFYFTTRKRMATRYATKHGRLIRAFLKVLNPYSVTALQWANGEGLSPADARSQGYDGYQIVGQEDGVTWIVFSDDAIWQMQ